MDYVRLIQDAWSMTWRHRFLWILALFSGGSAGTCSSQGANFNPVNWTMQWPPSGTRGAEGTFPSPSIDLITTWVIEHLWLLIAIGVVVLLLALVFFVLRLITQGGIAQATAELGRGRSISLGQAWAAGVHLFWRYLGLWLILLVLTLIIALFVAGLVVAGIAFGSLLPDVGRVVLIVVGIFVGLLGTLALIVVSILFGILLAYAQRAIAVEDVGPIDALRSGYNLLRSYFGRSLLVWLINVGLGIVAGLILLLFVLALGIPLGILGAIVYAAFGFGVPLIVYGVLAGLVFIVVLWVVGAIVNTYFWSYWTLAYLRLGGQVETVA